MVSFHRTPQCGFICIFCIIFIFTWDMCRIVHRFTLNHFLRLYEPQLLDFWQHWNHHRTTTVTLFSINSYFFYFFFLKIRRSSLLMFTNTLLHKFLLIVGVFFKKRLTQNVWFRQGLIIVLRNWTFFCAVLFARDRNKGAILNRKIVLLGWWPFQIRWLLVDFLSFFQDRRSFFDCF